VIHLNENSWVDYQFNTDQFYIYEKTSEGGVYVIHFRGIRNFCKKIYGSFPVKISTLVITVRSSKGFLTYYIPNILWVGIYLDKKIIESDKFQKSLKNLEVVNFLKERYSFNDSLMKCLDLIEKEVIKKEDKEKFEKLGKFEKTKRIFRFCF